MRRGAVLVGSIAVHVAIGALLYGVKGRRAPAPPPRETIDVEIVPPARVAPEAGGGSEGGAGATAPSPAPPPPAVAPKPAPPSPPAPVVPEPAPAVTPRRALAPALTPAVASAVTDARGDAGGDGDANGDGDRNGDGDGGTGGGAGGGLGTGLGAGVGPGLAALSAPAALPPPLPPPPAPPPSPPVAEKPPSKARPPKLIYPKRDRQADDADTFVARLTVDTDGYVVGARLVRGRGGLRDELASQLVWRFRYAPALDDDGRAVRATIEQRFLVGH